MGPKNKSLPPLPLDAGINPYSQPGSDPTRRFPTQSSTGFIGGFTLKGKVKDVRKRLLQEIHGLRLRLKEQDVLIASLRAEICKSLSYYVPKNYARCDHISGRSADRATAR